MDLINFAYVILGITCLYFGGEYILNSSLAFAERAGIPKLFSAVVLIGFGTSAPELFVSFYAVIGDNSDVALGNIFGSNVANILLVASLGLVIAPIAKKLQFVKYESAFLILSSIVPIISYCLFDSITFAIGALLLVGLFVYFYLATTYPNADEIDEDVPSLNGRQIVFQFSFALALLLIGSKVLIMGAVGIATALGISQAVIGLTIVAIGTSLPEIATAIASARRGEGQMIMGNVLGSNIFNTLLVLGGIGVYTNIPISWTEFGNSLILMPIISVVLVGLIYANKLNRVFGIIGLIGYIIYIYNL